MSVKDAYCDALLCPSRRVFLASAGAFVAWSQIPQMAYAADRDRRLVVVILRGALDGLAAVPPVGDPDYASLRGDQAIGAPGMESVLPLDGFFGLNDSMPALHSRFASGEALIVHAAATPYRNRSHFDGQDVLESGMASPRAANTGWLNRAVDSLPVGDKIATAGGLAVSPTVPLILRGKAPTLTWTPADFQPASPDTAERLLDLYAHTDPDMARIFQAGEKIEAMTVGNKDAEAAKGIRGSFHRVATGAARLLARDDGPRVAVLSYDGWDTHYNEGADSGRLAKQLAALDAALAALATELGPVWRDTVVVVITEFGRTARLNGSEGTDHGTATTAFMLGGAVRGGRVLADWPGLKQAALYESRDLAPTTDLRAILKGILRDHLGLSEQSLANSVFPDSGAVRPLEGLIS